MTNKKGSSVKLYRAFGFGIGLLALVSTYLLARPFSNLQPPNTESQAKPAASAEKKKPEKPIDPQVAKAAANKKKAEELLNQCYQEALGTTPDLQADALTRIGKSMSQINRDRAIYIYQQAFQATQEMQDPSVAKDKAMRQMSMVMSVLPLDPEKALQFALKMDRIYPTSDDEAPPPIDFRAAALGMVASRIAQKNPDRAFEIVEDQIAQGNFDPNLITPVAMQLQEKRPAKAEQLFVEAINQFDRPEHDDIQAQNFCSLTSRLFHLNHALTAKALDLLVKAVDELGKKQQDQSVAFSFSTYGGGGKAAVGSVREFVAIQVVAMMRRLDPARAKQLEASYAQFSNQLNKFPNGVFPIGDSAGTQGGATTGQQMKMTLAGPGGVVSGSTASGSGGTTESASSANPGAGQNRNFQVIITQSSDQTGGSTPPKIDPNSIASQIQSQQQKNQAINQAANNPQTGINTAMQIESPTTRAEALARVAAVIYKTGPEKAKSLLSEAYNAAEKISDPFDQAEVYGYISDGYFNFDQDKALSVLMEAIGVADKALQKEKEAPQATPFRKGPPPEYWRSNQLYENLISRLARFDIDRAIAKADQIDDPRIRLMTKISMADYVLNDGTSEENMYRVMLK